MIELQSISETDVKMWLQSRYDQTDALLQEADKKCHRLRSQLGEANAIRDKLHKKLDAIDQMLEELP